MRQAPSATTVTDQLRERILSGALRAGTRLNQAQLATELGVSRIPVRDALHTLAGEGLVQVHGRQGAQVTAMSTDDLEEIYELVEAIEPLACRRAVTNLGRASILHLTRLHEQMRETSDRATWMRLNHEFHHDIYRASGRPRTVALIDNLRRQKDRYLRLYVSLAGDLDALHDEHARLLRAIENGDGAAAAEVTLQHLRTSRDVILRHLMRAEADVAAADGNDAM